jgi:hypothetical protein
LQLEDDLLERELLMGEGCDRRAAYPTEQAFEAWRPRKVGPQYDGVDKEADQLLELLPRPAGRGRADRDVLLARMAVEQGREGGEEHHEQRPPLPLPEGSEARGGRPGDREAPHRAMEGLERRPGPVGGKLQRLEAGEGLPPVGELPLQDLAREPLSLPAGVVEILDRQLGKR